MSIAIKNGDLLKSGADYICHQVNCQGIMGSGVARAIKEAYPIVYRKYMNAAKWKDIGFGDKQADWDYMLGSIQLVDINDTQCVINMFCQRYYGNDGIRYTSYDAFWTALNDIAYNVPKGSSISFPYGIGCVRGGANWNIILAMITEVLGKDYNVEIWRLNNG